MEYISTKEAAYKWGVSVRNVQRLLSGGRIEGAVKYGVSWMIPSDAQKPSDPRKHGKHAKQEKTEYLACFMLSSFIPIACANPYSAVDFISEEKQKAQYLAEIEYLRGNLKYVKEYYKTISPTDSTYFCAATMAVAAAMGTGDYRLFEEIEETLKEVACENAAKTTKLCAAVVRAFAAVCINAPSIAPPWLQNADFSEFPKEAMPLLMMMRVKYLQSIKDFSGMLATAQSALCLLSAYSTYTDRRKSTKEGYFTIIDLYLTILCACASYGKGETNLVREYLERAVSLSAPCFFISPLAEYASAVGGFMNMALAKAERGFGDAVLKSFSQTLTNWLSFHNKFEKENITTILLAREYQLAVLLREGKTYAQIGDQMHLSVGRVRNIVSGIYQKLGISSRKEISERVL